MRKAKAAPVPDEHAGMGGSYVVDADGKRRLVERTKEAPAKPENEAKEKNDGNADA